MKGILYYERIGWVPIEEVMLKAFLGQRYRVARDAADDFIEDGVPLELVLKPEGTGKGWDSLAVLLAPVRIRRVAPVFSADA